MKKKMLAALLCICMLAAFPSPTSLIKGKNRRHTSSAILNNSDTTGIKEKTYCASYMQTKYKVLITGNKIRITRLYKEFEDVFTGTIKNSKIYSNDPEEKKYKPVWGKYYKFQGNHFSVLNAENGEYDWFSLCKE